MATNTIITDWKHSFALPMVAAFSAILISTSLHCNNFAVSIPAIIVAWTHVIIHKRTHFFLHTLIAQANKSHF